MKRILLAAALALGLAGCAHSGAEYGPAYGYAGGVFLGDCVYSDICGPGEYGSYFYYYPYFTSGPGSPQRLRVELAPRPANPRTVKRPTASSATRAPSAVTARSSSPTASSSSRSISPSRSVSSHSAGARSVGSRR